MLYRLKDIVWFYGKEGDFVMPFVKNNSNTKIKNILTDEQINVEIQDPLYWPFEATSHIESFYNVTNLGFINAKSLDSKLSIIESLRYDKIFKQKEVDLVNKENLIKITKVCKKTFAKLANEKREENKKIAKIKNCIDSNLEF